MEEKKKIEDLQQLCIPTKDTVVEHKYITKHIPSSKAYLQQLSIPAKDILLEHKYITKYISSNYVFQQKQIVTSTPSISEVCNNFIE